jgi:phage major head subunit gpT-like protein
MIINATALRTLYTGYSAAFQGGLSNVAPMYGRIAMTVSSTTRQNEYGWLGKFPKVREWLGERVVNSISVSAYAIRNRKFELTVDVDVDDIEDDNLGVYTPMFTEMGSAVAAFPDELLWPMLPGGFTGLCYDGRPFFDANHPVLDANGNTISVSNTGGGSGTAWYLIDDTRSIKPLIYQTRRPFQMRRMDAATDENVFKEGKAIYGVDGRANAGYGFWQLAYASKQALTAANYAAARAAMSGMLGDHGRPLAIRPTRLIVPPSLEAAGREILKAERNAAGASNVWMGSAELEVVPWLS